MTKKQVQLVLKTADIPILDANGNVQPKYDADGTPSYRLQAYDNSKYYINLFQSNYKFKSINMRALLDPIWEEGAEYILELKSLTFGLPCDGLTYGAENENERVFNIYIKGLPLLESSSSSSSSMNKALLATVRVAGYGTIVQYIFNSNRLSFTLNNAMSNQLVELEFAYRDIETDELLPRDNSVCYPNAQYVFTIYKS